MNPKNWS